VKLDTLHPQIRSLIEAAADEGPLDLAAARAGYLQSAIELGGAIEPVAGVDDIVIPRADGGRIPARVYRPQTPAQAPGAMVWFHGGGWCWGDLEGYDRVARSLANAAGHTLVSVDYRLAPEDPFPASVEDACAAASWAREAGAEQLGTDPGRVLVGGDSAGGNLAALAALEARDAGDGLPPLRAQMLVYPALVPSLDTEAAREFADGYMLTTDDMHACWANWLADADPARATPLGRDLAGMPAAAIAVAGHDPLRDDGLRYADELRAAGVQTDVRNYQDVVHGFIRWAGVVDRARELHRWLGDRAREALG
jgi:acetyl esterase/lipase